MASGERYPGFSLAEKAISREIDAVALERVQTRSRGYKLDAEGAIQPAININAGNEISQQLERQASLGISPYPGKGTAEEPFLVDWLPDEDANPYNWKTGFKWLFIVMSSMTCLCVAFGSSCYSGAAEIMAVHFQVKEQIVILGLSLYVLGFGVGPMLWAPLSEMYGRRIVFLVSYAPFALFHLGGLGHNMHTIIICRFFAGAFGSSMLTNAGAMIADVFEPRERGLPTTLFALAPFFGPSIGPLIGGFAATSHLGYKSVFYIMFIFSVVMYTLGFFFMPETYAPTLIRRRAKALEKASVAQGGQLQYYVAKFDVNKKTTRELFKTNMTRPFVLLFLEPMVFLLSVYIALIYGTLYLFFTAYPLVFQSPPPRGYGWSAGIAGLPFLGFGIGMVCAAALQPVFSRLYTKAIIKSGVGRAPPEARLPSACIGAIALPISLFWFAWTSWPKVHWIVPILAGIPFGFGLLLVFTSVLSYLIDSYLLFAASALAANAILRALAACFLPHVGVYMFNNLGDQWAATLVGFLSLICVPLPFLFYRYGPKIRARSRFAPKLPLAPPPPAAAASSAQPAISKQAPSSTASSHQDRSDAESVREGPESTVCSHERSQSTLFVNEKSQLPIRSDHSLEQSEPEYFTYAEGAPHTKQPTGHDAV